MDLLLGDDSSWRTVAIESSLVTLGGAVDDAIRIEGLPPALLTLRIEAGRLLIRAAQTLRVGGSLCPPRVLRLLLAGEAVELPDGQRLKAQERTPRPVAPTAAVLQGLLAGGSHSSVSAPTLTCLTGLDMGRAFTIAESEVSVGRGPDATLRIRDRAVSRMHARIRQSADGLVLSDTGSPNGIYVNGQKLSGSRRLEDGDILELGQSLLRFELPPREATRAARPSALNTNPAPEAQAEPTPSRRVGRLEWWIVGFGILITMAGAGLTWHLTV